MDRNTIHRFAEILEAYLREYEIVGRILRIVNGPYAVTYVISINPRSKAELRRMLDAPDVLRHLSGYGHISVEDNGTLVEVSVAKDAFNTPGLPWFVKHQRGANVVVGADKYGRPAYINMRKNPTVLFVGPTRRGKTSAVCSVLASVLLTRPIHFIVFSQKLNPWDVFVDCPYCVGVISDVKVIFPILSAIAAHMGTVVEAGERVVPILIIVDDLLNLLSVDKQISQVLSRIASVGGEAGVYQILCTQAAGTKAALGGMDLEANVRARVVYRTTNRLNAYHATGLSDNRVSNLTENSGDALLVIGDSQYRIATGHFDRDEYKELASGGFSGYADPFWIQKLARYLKKEEVSSVGGSSAVAVLPVRLPSVVGGRRLTVVESRAVYRAYMSGMSKNEICKTVYGYKNGTVMGYIDEAIGLVERSFMGGVVENADIR